MEWHSRAGLRLLEAELPAARAVFTTRLGGVSTGPFESLNLGLQVGDDAAAVRENRARLAAAVERDAAGFLIGRQVHGAKLRESAEAPAANPYLDPVAGAPPDSDAQLTRSPPLTAVVQVADCLPIAIAAPGGVGMLHCGWRASRASAPASRRTAG